MEIWLDTIDLAIVEDAAKLGIVSGVTTNPQILSKTKNISKTLVSLLDLQPGPVCVQVTSQNPDAMIEEGRKIYHFSSRMIVKVPINKNGLIAIKQLCKENIPVLGTGILFSTQALLAANLGVSYIAPYFSHIEKVGNTLETMKTIVDILRVQKLKTKVLAASLKQLDQLIYCAQLGVDAVTIKEDLYQKLIADHSAVEGFSEKFLQDWMQTHGEISIKDALLQ